MNMPQVKVDIIQVNIKAPTELHVVRPHSAKRQKLSIEHQIPQPIQQQANDKQQQQRPKSSHKLKHMQSVEDKGEFIDQNQHKRVSDNDQAVETITRIIHPQPQLPLQQIELQKIAQQGPNEEQNSKPLRHINMEQIYDKDEFNLRNSREKDSGKKRRLSESNIEGYFQQNNHFHVVNYLNELHKTIPQKVVQQQTNLQRKSKFLQCPSKKHIKNSFHSAHHSNDVSQQIQRMIVDQIDRKKKTRNQQEQQQENEQSQMQSIKQEKQQDDIVNTANLEQAREKIQSEIGVLSKVVGKEIGPQQNQHLYIEKSQTIDQEP